MDLPQYFLKTTLPFLIKQYYKHLVERIEKIFKEQDEEKHKLL